MAASHSTCLRASRLYIPRVPHQRVPQIHAQAAKADECLMVLNVVERLPIISQGVLDSLSRTEPHEVSVRRLKVLHQQIEELAALAARAKVCSVY